FQRPGQKIAVRGHVTAEIAVGEHTRESAARVHNAQAAGLGVGHRQQRFLTVRFSPATALRSPERMMSPTFSSIARPIAPEGCSRAKSLCLNPRACNTAIASASPSTSIAVVLDVGARLKGQASC